MILIKDYGSLNLPYPYRMGSNILIRTKNSYDISIIVYRGKYNYLYNKKKKYYNL